MGVITPAVKGCAEDDERDGRGRCRDLRDRLQHGRWNRQLHETAQCARNRTQNHRVHEHAAQDRQEVEASAAKGLEHEHAEHIVERDAHEDVVAAKDRLDHRAAPHIVRLDAADNPREDKCRQKHAARTECHQHRLEYRPRVGDIDVVEHHEEEEHAEHHAVHMAQLILSEQTRAPHEDTDRHQAKEGHNTAERDQKITEHKKTPPRPFSCIIAGKRGRGNGEIHVSHRRICRSRNVTICKSKARAISRARSQRQPTASGTCASEPTVT